MTFKWSSIDQALLPALSGVVKTFILTLQRYTFFSYLPNFGAANLKKVHFFFNESRQNSIKLNNSRIISILPKNDSSRLEQNSDEVHT